MLSRDSITFVQPDISKIEELAAKNSLRVKRFLRADLIPPSDRFEILHIQGKTASFLTSKYEGEQRFNNVRHYLELAILTAGSVNLDGYYSVNLWDIASGNDYTLDFTKLPDAYQMASYGGILAIRDPKEFDDKSNKIIFAGSSTGHHVPRMNQRLKVCAWGAKNRDICDFWITHLVNDNVEELVQEFGLLSREMIGEFQTVASQLDHKFILSVDGNVASWDRLVWIMNSNSLAFKFKSEFPDHDLWYYPLMSSGSEYIEVDFDSLREAYNYYLASPDEAKRVIRNAQDFVHRWLKPEVHIYYTLKLLVGAGIVA